MQIITYENISTKFIFHLLGLMIFLEGVVGGAGNVSYLPVLWWCVVSGTCGCCHDTQGSRQNATRPCADLVWIVLSCQAFLPE